MSGTNTKANKVDRALRRIGEINDQSIVIDQLTTTNTLLAETACRLEAENARLRRYLGSVLFARRQAEVPTLQTNIYHSARLPHTDAETV